MNRHAEESLGCALVKLHLINLVQQLEDKEQDRAQVFIDRAIARQSDPAKDARYSALEEFMSVAFYIQEDGNTLEDTRANFEFTHDQMNRMAKALELINSVAEEFGIIPSFSSLPIAA